MTADFRARARAWLQAHGTSFPAGDPYEVASAAQRTLHAAGFAGIAWPTRYGGQGLTDAERQAFDEEALAYDIPVGPLGIGLGMVVPILLDLGTEEQKQRYVPPLVRGDRLGCQMFSEPGAGSDVASLRTRAVRDGDHWVINGQKVWTSHAHRADTGILLARTGTGADRHEGITMFVIDMHAPGVTVRGLKDMTGATDFNEVFFDDLRLPAEAVVGEVGQGWAAAVRMLKHERVYLTSRMQPADDPSSAVSLAAAVRACGRAGDAAARRALAEVFVTQRVAELFAARIAEEVSSGADPGPRGSVGKLAHGRQARLLASVMTTLVGARATAWRPDDPAGEALSWVVTSAPRARIAGGTDEIQRNIIAERILGLPKERS